MSDDSKKVYGVNLESEVTPLLAHDALVECFFEAHCADTGLGMDNPAVSVAR